MQRFLAADAGRQHRDGLLGFGAKRRGRAGQRGDDADLDVGERQRGVMADEVREVMPDAVVRLPNGYDAVNYSMLLAQELC